MTLRLFIAGDTTRSKAAVQRVSALCESYPGGLVQLEIVDVLDRPEDAELNRVLATPTLLRLAPLPCKRVVGDMSDREVLQRLVEGPSASVVM